MAAEIVVRTTKDEYVGGDTLYGYVRFMGSVQKPERRRNTTKDAERWRIT